MNHNIVPFKNQAYNVVRDLIFLKCDFGHFFCLFNDIYLYHQNLLQMFVFKHNQPI